MSNPSSVGPSSAGASQAGMGSKPTSGNGAAKVFKEFKWGLLTLFLLMAVVIGLVYDGGKKKVNTTGVKPIAEAPVGGTDLAGSNLGMDNTYPPNPGSGMDTNIIGRKFNDHESREEEFPKIKIIAIRGLTPETHGNASGIGISELCRQRVVDEMDRRITNMNCETAGHVTAAMIPISKQTDREIIDLALTCVGMVEPPDAKLMWIPNTLHLSELECSESYYNEAREQPTLMILEEPRPLPFDAVGNLPDHVSNHA